MAKVLTRKMICLGALSVGLIMAYFLGSLTMYCIDDHLTECVHPALWWYSMKEGDRAAWASSISSILVVIVTLIATAVALSAPFTEAKLRREEDKERRLQREKGQLFWLYQELWATRVKLVDSPFLRGEVDISVMTVEDLLEQVRGVSLEADSGISQILKESEILDPDTFELILRVLRSMASYRLVHAEAVSGLSLLNPNTAATSLDRHTYVGIYRSLHQYGVGGEGSDAVIPNVANLLGALRRKYPREMGNLAV